MVKHSGGQPGSVPGPGSVVALSSATQIRVDPVQQRKSSQIPPQRLTVTLRRSVGYAWTAEPAAPNPGRAATNVIRKFTAFSSC